MAQFKHISNAAITIKIQHSGTHTHTHTHTQLQGKGLKGNSILSTLMPSHIYIYMNERCVYIALYSVLLYTQRALQSCGGGLSSTTISVCSIHRQRHSPHTSYIHTVFLCGSVVEHCVRSAKGCGFDSQGTHILMKNV